MVKWLCMCLILLMACAKGPDMFKKAGGLETEIRNVEDFNSIEVYKNIKLYLKQGSENKISISYGKNLLPKIKTNVKNGVLKIDDKNTFNWVRDLKQYAKCTLTLKTLESLLIEGSAQVKCIDSINGNKLVIKHNSNQDQNLLLNMGVVSGSCENSGALTLKGKSNILAWTVKKGSFLDAGDLENDDTYFFHFTKNDCILNPNQVLEANIGNSGNIIIKSNPSRILNRTGNGSGVIKL